MFVNLQTSRFQHLQTTRFLLYVETLQISVSAFPIPLLTLGVNDSRLSSQSPHVLIADFPESPLRVPPSTIWFDLLAERNFLNGQGNVNQVGLLQRRERSCPILFT